VIEEYSMASDPSDPSDPSDKSSGKPPTTSAERRAQARADKPKQSAPFKNRSHSTAARNPNLPKGGGPGPGKSGGSRPGGRGDR
jgi:hypothetical protein